MLLPHLWRKATSSKLLTQPHPVSQNFLKPPCWDGLLGLTHAAKDRRSSPLWSSWTHGGRMVKESVTKTLREGEFGRSGWDGCLRGSHHQRRLSCIPGEAGNVDSKRTVLRGDVSGHWSKNLAVGEVWWNCGEILLISLEEIPITRGDNAGFGSVRKSSATDAVVWRLRATGDQRPAAARRQLKCFLAARHQIRIRLAQRCWRLWILLGGFGWHTSLKSFGSRWQRLWNGNRIKGCAPIIQVFKLLDGVPKKGASTPPPYTSWDGYRANPICMSCIQGGLTTVSYPWGVQRHCSKPFRLSVTWVKAVSIFLAGSQTCFGGCSALPRVFPCHNFCLWSPW